ncbi:hypothetical protein [Riemerella columbina]|nr:hypothetical protein [Riemerella columbina]WKS95809.1 hypothetical protein NYR17_03450 [Riemerella columbina]
MTNQAKNLKIEDDYLNYTQAQLDVRGAIKSEPHRIQWIARITMLALFAM